MKRGVPLRNLCVLRFSAVRYIIHKAARNTEKNIIPKNLKNTGQNGCFSPFESGIYQYIRISGVNPFRSTKK
jgi:hypothetical protein